MVFKSDRQRRGFFGSRGNVRSNINPNISNKNIELREFKDKFGNISIIQNPVGKKGSIVIVETIFKKNGVQTQFEAKPSIVSKKTISTSKGDVVNFARKLARQGFKQVRIVP